MRRQGVERRSNDKGRGENCRWERAMGDVNQGLGGDEGAR